MFIQVIQGAAADAAALRRQWERWDSDLRPFTAGFLGATAGLTDAGAFIAMVRFESAQAARRNAARAVQENWWRSTVRHLDHLIVRDSVRTDVWNRGGSDDAGFVQIRCGVSSNPERLRDLYVNQQPVRMGPFRPEVLGGAFAWHDHNAFTLSAYFTSEADARRGENLHEFASFFADIDAVMQDLTYLDLREPWLSSAPEPVSRQPA